MKIELWSDFACPFCYIGKVRFDKALKNFPHKDEVEVVYKAYQLNPNAPKVMKTTPEKAFAKGHGITPEKAKEKFNMFKQTAASEGLKYDYDNIQMTNSFDAHRVAKWARKYDLEPELTNRFMKAYFEEGKNIADHDTLIELVKEFDLDQTEAKKVLKNNEYEDVVKNEISESRQVGVQGVPFFVLNRKYAVSGAQPQENFKQVLEKLYEEEHPLKKMDGLNSGDACTDESC
ncbi:MAG: DsbA family oxidoreductase [Candidatus Izimaplasma sp.]|nr:DsbA family oxidoreductase [Candidatus Izimaplasma bacterium]